MYINKIRYGLKQPPLGIHTKYHFHQKCNKIHELI